MPLRIHRFHSFVRSLAGLLVRTESEVLDLQIEEPRLKIGQDIVESFELLQTTSPSYLPMARDKRFALLVE